MRRGGVIDDTQSEALRRGAQQFQSAFVHSAIGMALVAPSGRWLMVNRSLCSLLGYTEEELCESDFQSVTHPEDLDSDLAFVEQLLAGTLETYQMEKRYLHRRGHIVWALLSVSLVRDSSGSPLHFISQIQNISERKEVQIALQSSEARYRSLSNQAPVGIFETNATGECLYVNERWQEMTGISLAEALGHGWARAIHPEDREKVFAAWQSAVLSRSEFQLEYRYGQSTTGERWVSGNAVALHDESGQITGYLGTAMDITERKGAELSALRSLAEKEVMLKEIHHRVKNNLQIISSLLYFQARSLPDGRERALFRESQDRVRSMALIHEKLYQSESLSRVDFAEYARGLCLELMRSYCASSGSVRLCTHLEPISMDVDLAIPCGLILNELVSNALKHAFCENGGGTLTIELRRSGPTTGLLAVIDNGRGLPAALVPDKASSLGLKLVQTFVQQIEGTLSVDGANGARFSITFPLPELPATPLRSDKETHP